MRRKIYSIVLLAVGLLIGTNVWANLPQRPLLGQQNPQSAELRISPQGVEQLVPMATPQPKHSQSSLAKAPRKAAMAGDVLKVVKPSGEEVFYDATNFGNVWEELVAGDSIVLLGNISTCGAYITVDNVTLDLNGHYLVSSYDGKTSLSSQLYLLITTGNNIVIKNGYVWDDNYTFIYSDGKTYNNYGIEAWGGSLTLENVTTDGDYWGSAYMIYAGNNATVEIKDCEINACFYAIYNAGADITINQSEGKECKIEGHYDKTIYQTKGSITLNGGTITNSRAMCVAIYGGNLTINGGVVSTSVDHTIYVYPWKTANVGSTVTINGGTIENTATAIGTDGNASCIWICDYYAATLKVFGGEFKPSTTYRGCAIFASCYGGGPKVYVEGGKFYSPLDHSIIFVKVANTTFDVKGGFFEKAELGNYVQLPTGYSFLPQNEDGFYEVSNVLFSIEGKGGYSYDDVQAAWEDGDNLTLKRPTTVEDGDITIAKSVSLDLTDYSMEKLIVSAGKTVNIYGTRGASIKEIVGEGTVVIYAGTYPFDPTSYLADGLSARKNESTNMWVVGEGAEVSMDGVEYWTLADAIAAAPQEQQVTITLLRSISMSKGVSISDKQNIVIELNGKQISCDEHMVKPMTAMIENRGTLTVQDNTDTDKNGSGTGLLAYAFLTPNPVVLPGSTSNVITNRGTLYVKSGAMYNDAYGSACYDIDNYANDNNAFLYITGGKFTSKASMSIRMCTFKSTKNIVSIKNAIVGSFWLQEYNKTEGQGYLEFDNCEFLHNIGLGYDENYANFENLSVIIKNTEINGEFVDIFNPAARAQDSAYVMDNNVVRAYFLDYPYACLTNGFYQFATPRYYKLMNGSDAKNYKEDDGWTCIPSEEHPGFIDVYMSPEKLLRDFNKNIAPGYALVSRPDFKGEDNWYEVVLAQGTTDAEDVEDRDGELGNPWHQNKTWTLEDLEEGKDAVPEETTAVLIDHNVYVEENTQAVAASLQIEAGQTLTVKSGATLQIQDAGALFKDGTAKLVIEPEAVVTVGSNGVIADNVDNIIIEASATEVGNFLLHPNVVLNTKPDATVRMVANVGKSGNDYTWHRFAMPVEKLETPWTKVPDYGTLLYEWSYSKGDWDQTAGGSTGMKPFLGYTITTQKPVTDVEYTFTGNLLGNNPSEIDFQQLGYGYFGNSYTGYILAKEMLNGFKDVEGVEGQVWMWNAAQQSYTGVSLRDLWEHENRLEDYEKEVAPMQTFILKTNTGLGATINIDYMKAIWGNPRYGLVEEPTAAPARYNAENEDNAFAKIMITAANGQSDEVRLTENDANEDAYENSVDATKYFNKNHINIYTSVEGEDYTSLYTNNLLDKEITLQTQNEVAYTLSVGYAEGGKYALQDMLTGAIIPLEQGTTYNFAAQSNTTSKRFRVVEARKVVTNIDNVEASRSAKGIYTVLGQYVGETSMFNTLPAGVYVIDGVKIIK